MAQRPGARTRSSPVSGPLLEVRDRQGSMKAFPLLTISVGVATTSNRRFSHYGEAVAVATEMKQFAKRDPGSSFAVDRRAITG